MSVAFPETRTAAPPFAWPGARLVLRSFVLLCLGGIWFAIVYGGADFLTGLHSRRVRIHFDFELGIPFVPAMTLAYVSLYPMLWISAFVLRRSRALDTLALAVMIETAVAGVIFVLFPAQAAFPPHGDLGPWAVLFRGADTLNLTYNMLPSLHVAFACTCALLYGARSGPHGDAQRRDAGKRAFFGAWASLIAASTVLTHQHHLADVAAGALLAWGIVHLVTRHVLPETRVLARERWQ